MKRLSLYFVLLCVTFLWSCVHETIHELPAGELSVSWENSRAGQNHSDAAFYLYPDFDYSSNPIFVQSQNGKPISLRLLPGTYKVMMHNYPSGNLIVEGQARYEDLNASINLVEGAVPDIDQFMVLGPGDTNRIIKIDAGAQNNIRVTPISASKSIRFVVNSEKFGSIESVRAKISGLATNLNLSTFVSSKYESRELNQWKVDGQTFVSSPVELLGFDYAPNSVGLKLYVKVLESEQELDQLVDLTEVVKDLEGDEIEVKLDVEFRPDIRIRLVDIRQWLAGEELSIDVW